MTQIADPTCDGCIYDVDGMTCAKSRECHRRPMKTFPGEQAELTLDLADDAARDAFAEKVHEAQEMLAEMRTDDDGPVDDRTPAQIAEDKGDEKYHELVDEGRADEVRPGGVR